MDLGVRLPAVDKRRIQRVNILMEFQDVPKSKKVADVIFHAQIVPRDARIAGNTQKESDKLIQASLVEMSFDVTDLVRSHLELGKKHFKVKMNFLLGGKSKTSALHGGHHNTTAFLVFYEGGVSDQQNDNTSSTANDIGWSDGESRIVKKTADGTLRNAEKKKGKNKRRKEFEMNSEFYSHPKYIPRVGTFGTTCALHSWKVSSQKLPWAFQVVHPPEIDVNRCQGSCYKRLKPPAFRHELGAYMRAVFLSRIPCCVPILFQPQLMIVQFKGFLQFRLSEKLKAGVCGCL